MKHGENIGTLRWLFVLQITKPNLPNIYIVMWLFFYLPNVLQRIFSNECHLYYRYDNKKDSLQQKR
jgi:hypothetical protein